MCAVLFAGQTETSLPGAGTLLAVPSSLLLFLQAEHGQLNLYIGASPQGEHPGIQRSQ